MPTTLAGILILSVFPILLVAGGIGDFLTMRIPNWLNGALIVSFFVMIFVAGMPFDVIKWHLAAAGIVLVAGIILFFAIEFGGGDSKMLAASALWIGWDPLVNFILYTAIAGGGLSVLVIIWRRIGHERDMRGAVWLRNLFNKQIKVPYGVAIAIGGIVAYSETWWIKSMI